MKRKNPRVLSLFEWAETLAVSIAAVILLISVVVRHSPVNGHSMFPTLLGTAVGAYDEYAAPDGKNDVLLISDLLYTPTAGDLVVTQSDYNMNEPLVKRVIAVGGQTLRIDFAKWEVYVDGKLLDETYVNREDFSMRSDNYVSVMNVCDRAEDGAYIIPDGYIFCMGDNRNHSSDSRFAGVGLIDERYVVGKVVLRIFPFDRIGTVS